MSKKVQISPLGDRVIVDPKINDGNTKSGIIIPENANKEKPKQGEVVGVGELKDIKDVKVGDTVVFSDYGYDEVEIDGKKYFIVQSKNLLAVIK